jgi:WXG100 protein secretion system (Wss), protein YukD/FHA domain
MDLHFHIQIPDGRSMPVAFPAELSAGQLLSELLTDEKLAIQPPHPGAWHLHNENTNQQLDPNKTLQQNGVAGGNRILLLPHKHDAQAAEEPAVGGGSRALTRCDNGHYYDAKKHTKCPFCGIAVIDFGPRSLKIEAVSDEHTRPAGLKVAPTNHAVDDDAVTRPVQLVHDLARIDPVVGWFVNVAGPEKGKDYRIRSENNTIGRSKDMYICISGDESISRERHAVITFDPTRNAFHLSPGEGRGLVFLNGEALLAHKELAPFDVISLGKTKLVFVPFCGEKFKWE